MVKKSHRFLKVFLIIIIVLAVIFVGGFFGAKLYLSSIQQKAAQQSEQLFNDTVLVDADNDIKAETLPESDYDIDYDGDGLTNKKEIDLGTSFFHTDTDGDGLTDYDEVKKYSSDPLKVSTAEDGISDLVKAVKNMDFKTSYSDTALEKVQLAENLFLMPGDLNSSLLYVYNEYQGSLFKDWTCLTPPFTVQDASGELSCELKGEFTAKNTAVYYYDPETRSVTEDKSAKVNDNILSFSCRQGIPTVVTRKDLIPIGLLRSDTNKDLQKIRKFYMLIVPFTQMNTSSIPDIGVGKYTLASFIKEKDTIFILAIDGLEGLRSFEGDSELEERIKAKASNWDVDQYYVGQTLFDLAKTLYDRYAASDDPETREAIANIQIKEITCTEAGLVDEVILFMSANGYIIEDDPDTLLMIAHSGFDVDENGFPFNNLSTSLSEGGVCAGFSFLARQGYNGFPLDRQRGSYSFSTYSYPGYSAGAAEYNEIFTGRLGEYEPKSNPLTSMSDTVYDSYDQGYLVDANKLADPDKTVVDLLNYYWLYNNGERIKYEQSSGILKTYDYRFSTIEDLYNEFKAGRVVEMGIYGAPGGHAIVGYALRQDPSDRNLFYLSVYDSNFPGNKRFAYAAGKVVKVKTDVTMMIRKVSRKIMGSSGQLETVDFFTFHYQVGSSSYRWSNLTGGTDRVVFYKTGTDGRHSVFVR